MRELLGVEAIQANQLRPSHSHDAQALLYFLVRPDVRDDQMNGQMNGRTGGLMGGLMGGRRDGRRDGRTDGLENASKNNLLHKFIFFL